MEEYSLTLQDKFDLLKKWNKRARESQFAHYQAELEYKRYHFYVGLPAILFSVLANGAIVFGEFIEPSVLRLIVALATFLSSVLISVQTFVRFSKLSEEHLNSAVKYGIVRRNIEELYVEMKSDNSEKDYFREINHIKDKIDDLALNSPNIANKIWEKSLKFTKNGAT